MDVITSTLIVVCFYYFRGELLPVFVPHESADGQEEAGRCVSFGALLEQS